jgi:hypothetical protein
LLSILEIISHMLSFWWFNKIAPTKQASSAQPCFLKQNKPKLL